MFKFINFLLFLLLFAFFGAHWIFLGYGIKNSLHSSFFHILDFRFRIHGMLLSCRFDCWFLKSGFVFICFEQLLFIFGNTEEAIDFFDLELVEIRAFKVVVEANGLFADILSPLDLPIELSVVHIAEPAIKLFVSFVLISFTRANLVEETF